MIEIAASILSADFARLGEQALSAMEGGGAEILVAGSAIFEHRDLRESTRQLLARARA